MNIQDHAVFLEVVMQPSDPDPVQSDDDGEEIVRFKIGSLVPYENGENWRFMCHGEILNADGNLMQKSEIPILLVRNSNNQHATKSEEASQIADMVSGAICQNSEWEVLAWRITIAWNGMESSPPSDAVIH